MFFPKILARRRRGGKRIPGAGTWARSRRLAMEPLEGRDLLSAIALAVVANPTVITSETRVFSLAVTYNEPYVTQPTTFSKDVSGVLNPDPVLSIWINSTTYRAGFDVGGTPAYIPDVGVTVGSVYFPDVFDINTFATPAHVISAVPSVTQVTQDNLGPNGTVGIPNPTTPGQGLIVRVFYDTDMSYKPAYTPVVTLPHSTIGTLPIDPTWSYWVNRRQYNAGFDVLPSTNLVAQGMSVSVTGAHDLANDYLQDPYNGGVVPLNVDMTHAAPRAQVTLLYPNLTLISSRNVGTDTFIVRLSFNEAMNSGANLAFSFSQWVNGTANPVDLSNVLQLETDTSGWVNSTDYKAVFTVLPGTSVNLANLGVNVLNGWDPIGNPPTPYTSPATFSIDTLDAPPPLAQVKSITTNLETVTAANTMANAGPDSFVVWVQYDQPMLWYGSIPTLSFVPDPKWYPVAGTLQLGLANSWWTGPDTYVARFTVQNYYTIVNPSVGIAVSGGKDAIGNLQAPYSGGTDVFEVNTTTSPLASVTGVVPSAPVVTKATVGAPVAGQWTTGFVERITFDQPMAGYSPVVTLTANDPTQQQALNNTLGFDSGWSWWFDATTFRAAFDVADSGVKVQDITIHVKWARAGTTYPYYDQVRYSGPANFSIDTLTPLSLGSLAASTSASSLTDAVLSSGALNLSIGSLYDRQECLSPATSTNDQQTVNPIDSALTLTGTWLDV